MPKTKISVTVDAKLVREVDRSAKVASRSEIVEMALASWLRDRRLRRLEEETERYYAGLSRDEAEEDADWADLSLRSLGDAWK